MASANALRARNQAKKEAIKGVTKQANKRGKPTSKPTREHAETTEQVDISLGAINVGVASHTPVKGQGPPQGSGVGGVGLDPPVLCGPIFFYSQYRKSGVPIPAWEVTSLEKTSPKWAQPPHFRNSCRFGWPPISAACGVKHSCGFL